MYTLLRIPRPDQVVEHDELARSYRTALAQLSPRQQVVYRFIREDGWTFAQVAAHLKLSEGAVKTHFVRALATLNRELSPWL